MIITYNRQNIFVQLGFSMSKVTDKKFTWILIYQNKGRSIYSENDGLIKTKWN